MEDAGPAGVPAELAGTIFEPFRRGGNGEPAQTMAHARGVGIGCPWWPGSRPCTAATPGSTSASGQAAHVLLPDVVSYDRGYAQVLDRL